MTETSPPLESGGVAAAVESAPKAGPMRRIRVTDFYKPSANTSAGRC